MVQLPIPLGQDPALPLPMQPRALGGAAGDPFQGQWQILPDGSFVPTAANTTGDISSPNGFDIAGSPAVINLGGGFRLQAPDNTTGITVFGGSGDTRTALYGNPILFLDRAANQFMVMTPTSLDPFGAAVGVYNLGAVGARFNNIYANNVDVTGAFTINGVPLTPGSGGPITWAMITGTPTTIAGYGITDAYTKAQSDAKYALIGDGLHGFWAVDGTGQFSPTAANTNANITALTINATQTNPLTSATAYFIAGAPILTRDTLDMNGNNVTSGTNVITDISGRYFIEIYRDPNTVGFIVDQIIIASRSVAPTINYLTFTVAAMVPMGAAINAFNLGASTARLGTVFANTLDVLNPITVNGAPFTVSFANITNKPTTLAGYGITDALTASSQISWSNVINRPTTIAGYGITDAFTQAQADARYAPIAGPFPWSGVTGRPTTLAGYGITDGLTQAQADARYAPIGSGGGTLTHWQDQSTGQFVPLVSNSNPDLGLSNQRIRTIYAATLDLTGNATIAGNLILTGATSDIIINGLATWPWYENTGTPPYVYLNSPGNVLTIKVDSPQSLGGAGGITFYADSFAMLNRAGTIPFYTFNQQGIFPSQSPMDLGSSANRFGTLYANSINLPAGATVTGAFRSIVVSALAVPTGTPTLLFTPVQSIGTCYLISAAPIPGTNAGSLLYGLISDGSNFYLFQMKTPPANMSLTMSANQLQVNISQSTGAAQTWTAYILRIA